VIERIIDNRPIAGHAAVAVNRLLSNVRSPSLCKDSTLESALWGGGMTIRSCSVVLLAWVIVSSHLVRPRI